MMRMIAGVVVRVVTAFVALLLTAALLEDFNIAVFGYPIVLAIFVLVSLVARPALETIIDENVQWAASFVGLVAAFVSLLVTDLISDDLEISGVTTWVLASLIVWIGGIVADLLIGRWLFRKIAGDRDRRRR
jgi:putative membrane protein